GLDLVLGPTRDHERDPLLSGRPLFAVRLADLGDEAVERLRTAGLDAWLAGAHGSELLVLGQADTKPHPERPGLSSTAPSWAESKVPRFLSFAPGRVSVAEVVRLTARTPNSRAKAARAAAAEQAQRREADRIARLKAEAEAEQRRWLDT